VLELTQVIDAHQALQRPLLSLLGRLDLLLHKQNVSRAVRKKKDDADGDESDGTEGPVNVYDETSDLDVMDEDMAGEGESEEDWETDSDEGGEESGEDEDEDGNGESDSE
jgi:U3 small nucleolar RNA-associated protein 5